MLIPSPPSPGLRAVGRITAVLALAAGLSTATLTILTRNHAGGHRSAAEWTLPSAPTPEGATGVGGGMESTESLSDPRRSGSGSP